MCSYKRLFQWLVVAQFALIGILVFRQHAPEAEHENLGGTDQLLQLRSVPVPTIVLPTKHQLVNETSPTVSILKLSVLDDHSKVKRRNESHLDDSASKSVFDSPIFHCSAEVAKKYRTVAGSSTLEDLQWCKQMHVARGVVIGRSWGGLSGPDRLKWEDRKCNELISVGSLQSCDQRYGWKFFENWRNKAVPVILGISNVTCSNNIKASSFCKYKNVAADFTKMETSSTSRAFGPTFLTGLGEATAAASSFPVVGTFHSPLTQEETSPVCDIFETRPTFVLSNDDIFNLGHYYNDLMGVWGMLQLSGVDPQRAVLLNMDGWRERGPAGVGEHRIMVPGSPDEHGPFVSIYKSWFAEVQQTKDFSTRRVCYKKLYFPPKPGVPWCWEDWKRVNECSEQAASPLYQSYNLFMREKWSKKYGALPNPPTDKVHVVIEVRAINRNKAKLQSSSRHIANLPALVAALQSLPNVIVTAQDFALIPFERQVELAHSAGVFVSMHGAGTTHIFHSALGQPNCCALVELFTDKSAPFHDIKLFGNLARMLGMQHHPISAADGATSSGGTMVDIAAVKQAVIKAAESMGIKPTCLHDVHL